MDTAREVMVAVAPAIVTETLREAMVAVVAPATATCRKFAIAATDPVAAAGTVSVGRQIEGNAFCSRGVVVMSSQGQPIADEWGTASSRVESPINLGCLAGWRQQGLDVQHLHPHKSANR